MRSVRRAHARGLPVQGISVPRRLEALAEFLAKSRLESAHAVLVRAGEDGHELAALVVADDVFLPAQTRQRAVQIAIVLRGFDPVEREWLIELRHGLDIAPQPLFDFG